MRCRRRCLHERDRRGVGKQERDHRSYGVEAVSELFSRVDGRAAAAGSDSPVDDDHRDECRDPVADEQNRILKRVARSSA